MKIPVLQTVRDYAHVTGFSSEIHSYLRNVRIKTKQKIRDMYVSIHPFMISVSIIAVIVLSLFRPRPHESVFVQ